VKTVNFVELVARSALRTQAAGSAHVVVSTISHPTGVSGENLYLMGTGDIAYKPVREHLWFHYAAPSAGLNGTAAALLTGNVMYQYWPRLASRLPGGRPWIKERMTEIGSQLGINFDGIMNGASTRNPFQMLTNLEGASQLVRVGRAKVGGLATTEYRGAWDYRKLFRRGLITRTGLALLDGHLTNPTPFTVWIDREGRVRRLVWRREFLDSYAQSISEVTRFDYSNFGEPVSVTLPPVGVVSDVTASVIAHSHLISNQ
jgi:hypothetical protein